MSYTTLISTAELAAHLEDSAWAVIDCRFDLQDTELGRRRYAEAHIPGALYAHLDHDLSGPIVVGQTGRHPLPAVETLAATLSAWGIDASVQVVVYDDLSGAYAARLWWMLRWLGHERAAVLDGDWRHWQQEKRPIRGGVERRSQRLFIPRPRPEMQAGVDEVVANLENGDSLLLDARDETRYRGEVAGIDPVAGHIPGAISAYFGHNVGASGRMLPVEALRRRYNQLLGGRKPEEAIFYCGSGVTAAHDLLAMQHAALGQGRLYVGSWSDWINDSQRPVAVGDQP